MTNTDTLPAENQFRADHRNDKVEAMADAMHLAATLAQLRPDKTAYTAAIDAALMIRWGRALAGIAVKDCNYGITSRDETRRDNLRKKIETIASWYGLTTTTGGDPRGFVVRLHGPIKNNGWGDGFGVA